MRIAASAALMLALAGCHSPGPCAREEVSTGLACAAGLELGPANCPGETGLPPAVVIDDGVTEDEAVAVALWNNAAYQELLARLGISLADLLEAGLLSDPSLTALFPAGPKLWELTLTVPLEVFWLRPERIAAARLDLDQATADLVQAGLDLVRNVRQAHADLVLAQDRARLAAEARRLRSGIAELAERRLEAGDISELEAIGTRVEVLQADAAAERALLDVGVVETRLQQLLGLAQHVVELEAVVAAVPPPVERSADELVAVALDSRPDARAAAIAVEAAARRVRLARCQFLRVSGLVDSNETDDGDFDVGPGLDITLPIFNANRGGIARAEAVLEQATRRQHSVREQVVREVAVAHAQLVQAGANLEAIRTRILPTLEEAVELATRNYEQGGAAYFLVLQTTAQFLDARSRELELIADVHRAFAELERSVGRRIGGGSIGVPVEGAVPLPPEPSADKPMDAAATADESAPAAESPTGTAIRGCRPVKR